MGGYLGEGGVDCAVGQREKEEDNVRVLCVCCACVVRACVVKIKEKEKCGVVKARGIHAQRGRHQKRRRVFAQ